MALTRFLVAFLVVTGTVVWPAHAQDNERATGYQGIWFTLGQMGEYGDKYSGGLGTYTAKHRPIAVYSQAAEKTFFVYAGAKDGERYLLNMIGYYDHATGTVPRPVIVHDKGGVNDPHDNASLAIDGDGHLWVFISGRGRSRPGFIYRSREPYNIDSFEQVLEGEFTYPQPAWVAGNGFLHTFTKYTDGRELYWSTSPDGRAWSPDRKLAGMGGHYQATELRNDGAIYTAFNYHPGGNVDQRTNLYCVYTDDMGETWRTVDGTPVDTPLTDTDSPALVRDFTGSPLEGGGRRLTRSPLEGGGRRPGGVSAEHRLVYLKDLNFDRQGRPIILVVTSAHHMPGPQGDPRVWTIAHWTGDAWKFHEVTRSTHNYDMGQLWVEGDLWRILAPTEPGPQQWGAGGEIALWESTDEGETWTKIRDVTRDSAFNHTYVRRPRNAPDDFYALWADGNPDEKSPSRLYFTNRDGDEVYRLPFKLGTDYQFPAALHWPSSTSSGNW